MRKIMISMFGAGLVVLALVATAVAADPTPSPSTGDSTGDTIPAVLGLSQEAVMELRHEGLSLAQIAERQGVDPQDLVEAVQARWMERIQVRESNGAITSDEATALRLQLETRARDLIHRTTLGGMQGAAVGAGNGNGLGNGAGNGLGNGLGNGTGNGTGAGAMVRNGTGDASGTCDGTGPARAGQR